MKKLLLILVLASPAWSSQKYNFQDPLLTDEFVNNYKEHTFPRFVNAVGSTMTITQLNVSTASVKQIQFKDGTTQITAASASKWVQIAFGSATVTTNTTSTSYVDTNLSVPITPTSASNCILVIAQSDAQVTANAVAFNLFLTLANGSTNLNSASGSATATAIAASQIRFPVALIAPNCPASTSSQTYRVRIKVEDPGITGSLIAGSTTARIWAIEYVP